jgi:hypothetical protein
MQYHIHNQILYVTFNDMMIFSMNSYLSLKRSNSSSFTWKHVFTANPRSVKAVRSKNKKIVLVFLKFIITLVDEVK